MTIWRVFSPEYGRNVEIVRLKVWFLAMTRKYRRENEKNSKKEDKAKVKKLNKSNLNSLLLL